jgi:hypothetical protein
VDTSSTLFMICSRGELRTLTLNLSSPKKGKESAENDDDPV